MCRRPGDGTYVSREGRVAASQHEDPGRLVRDDLADDVRYVAVRLEPVKRRVFGLPTARCQYGMLLDSARLTACIVDP